MESKDDKDSFNKKYIIKSKKGFGGTAKAFLVYEKSSKIFYKIEESKTKRFMINRKAKKLEIKYISKYKESE